MHVSIAPDGISTSNKTIIEQLRKDFLPDEKGNFTNCAILFAYNGTGKTRLSRDFARYARGKDGKSNHTLYYNAYTEDLFSWDNDLENDAKPRLLINQDNALVKGLPGYNIETTVRKLLEPFVDIKPSFEYANSSPCAVHFSRTVKSKRKDDEGNWIDSTEEKEFIKISRGEERLFVWCFFRSIVDLVLGGNDAYNWVKYIYIDDPMSSLDDNNVIAFANQLYTTIRKNYNDTKDALKKDSAARRINFVISTHHALFFHAMVHGLNKQPRRYYLNRDKESDKVVMKDLDRSDTPFFYNVAMMYELQKAINEDKLFTYHFTILRSVMEKVKEFFGHSDFSYILDGIEYKGNVYQRPDKGEGVDGENEDISDLYSRVVNVLTHQGSMFTPTPMAPDNKELLVTLFNHLKNQYHFIIPNLDKTSKEKKK